MLSTYRVTTSLGSITVMASSIAEAIRTALELLGGEHRSALREGEW